MAGFDKVSWHRSRGADIMLRVAGVLGCVIAWRAIAHLVGQHVTAVSAGWLDVCLAALGFVAGSVGVLMAILGRHLFDEVEVSARWRRPVQDNWLYIPDTGALLDIAEADRLIVAQEDDGWSVHQRTAVLLRRSTTVEDAQHSADREVRGIHGAVGQTSPSHAVNRIEGRLSLCANDVEPRRRFHA